MTAEQLIEFLQGVPAKTKIYVWTDDGRKEICGSIPFDYWDDGDNPTADINISTSGLTPFDPISSGTTEI